MQVDSASGSAVQCDFLRQRWQVDPQASGSRALAASADLLLHDGLALFSSHTEAEDAHTAAPVVRLQGDYPYAADSSVAIALQPLGLEHLLTIAQIQMEQVWPPSPVALRALRACLFLQHLHWQ